MDIDQYAIPGTGLVGVTFKRTWNAYAAGKKAGFAPEQAQALRNAGLVEFHVYEEPAPRELRANALPIAPIRPHPAPDPVHTANVRRPGWAGPAPVPGSNDAPADSDGVDKSGDGTQAHDVSAEAKSAVAIPDDWGDLHHAKKMAIARELGAEPTNRDQAEAAIKEELDRRAQGPAAPAAEPVPGSGADGQPAA